MIERFGSLTRVYETLTPEQRSARAASGGKAAHSPQSLAKRLAKSSPQLSPEQRQDVITELTPLAEQDGQVDR